MTASPKQPIKTLNASEHNSLNVLTTNVNGLCSNTKQSELSILLNTHHIDVAVITESHLNEMTHVRQVMQAGYKTLRRDRNFTAVKKSKEGGIIIYLKNNITHIEPKLQVPEELEVCWCILKPTQPRSVIVAAVYLPPDACVAQRQMLNDHLVSTLDLLSLSFSKS